MIKTIKISVRNLVEFILREGDIDNTKGTGLNKDAMAAGSRMHGKIQKRMGSGYRVEVPLKIEIPQDDFTLILEGRADGILEEADAVTIDEIKGIYKNVEELHEPYGVHLAQAKCYAYIYAKENHLDKIGVQMTYCNLETEQIKRFQETISFENLEAWFIKLIDAYMEWARFDYQNKKLREETIKPLEFPYPYRKGQRDMAVAAYGSIRQGKNLFIQAPTGIGKTMAAIFPAVKAVGEGLGDKIFYLTAKTITASVAVESYDILREKGMHFKSIVITAKEKLCVCEEMDCNPENCPYAKGHYDRINAGVFDLVTHEDAITRDVILQYANKHQVCPFEMCLDASLWVDGIICDYNYVFDPRVNLKRYFGEGVQGSYIFLVDEAHNLVDRASKMYSAQIYKEDFLEMRKLVKPYSTKLYRYLGQCNDQFLVMKKECDTYNVVKDMDGFAVKLMRTLAEIETFMEEHKGFQERKQLLEFYFQLHHFMDMYERVDESYVIYTEQENSKSFFLKLYCVHTATNLQECLKRGNATIFFSATMLPISYYKELLSNHDEDYAIYIPSPFSKENRNILIGTDVSTKYSKRGQKEYEKIYSYIKDLFFAKPGNYMVFFPSYKMLEQVYDIAVGKGLTQQVTVLKQVPNMQEEKREAFLEAFHAESQIIGFCIMGGIFSEGIDLTRERLIGAVVVGTGLPMVCNERQIQMDYFKGLKGKGFEYAYLYPGMNKVEQAAGRVIRTEEDKGIILLLDERFKTPEYVSLFPMEWEDYQLIHKEKVMECVKQFWAKEKDWKNME